MRQVGIAVADFVDVEIDSARYMAKGVLLGGIALVMGKVERGINDADIGRIQMLFQPFL